MTRARLSDKPPYDTAFDLLLSAPDGQVKRCQLAVNAIAAGKWADAAHFLKNAANDTQGEWSEAARKLAAHCEELEG